MNWRANQLSLLGYSTRRQLFSRLSHIAKVMVQPQLGVNLLIVHVLLVDGLAAALSGCKFLA